MFDSPRFSNPGANQSSVFLQQGNDVAFTFNGGASAGGPDSDGSLVFKVGFSLDEATDFRLTGTGRAREDAPFFVFQNASGETVRNLRSFDQDPDTGNTSSDFDFTQLGAFDNGSNTPIGTLDAGTYLFGFSGRAQNPGSDSGSFGLTDFGIVFADSTLAIAGDPPAVIPSPAALPAGLALLAGGLLRRRRAA